MNSCIKKKKKNDPRKFGASQAIIQLNLPQEMKEEILIKAKIKNLRTKIYLMIITLDLNLVDDNDEIQEAYNQEEDLSEIFYRNLNKIGSPSIEI